MISVFFGFHWIGLDWIGLHGGCIEVWWWFGWCIIIIFYVSIKRFYAMSMLGSVGEDGVRFPLRALAWTCWCVCMRLRFPVTVSLLYDGCDEKGKRKGKYR